MAAWGMDEEKAPQNRQRKREEADFDWSERAHLPLLFSLSKSPLSWRTLPLSGSIAHNNSVRTADDVPNHCLVYIIAIAILLQRAMSRPRERAL